ncbi:MAG TPA: MarR family transcriptional regulator [Candidatus Limosilactobacillus excrementigallinarum]|nr:MarR family transcriptional regulator [Candidatus Limosilactobacillus excrementigallinarum]
MEPIKKLITQANTQINHEREQFSRNLGITGIQMSVIDFMANHHNHVSQQEIEQEFGIRRSTTTIMIKRMERHGLVHQIPDPTDKRKKLVELTDKAIQLINPIKEFIKNDDLQIRQAFSDDELAVACKILNYIREDQLNG